MAKQFLSRNAPIKVADAAGAATSTVTATIDLYAYPGAQEFIFLASFGTAAANNTLKAGIGAASNGSDATDLAGTSVGVGASDEDVILAVARPVGGRYLTVSALRGTSTTLENLWMIVAGIDDAFSKASVTGTAKAEQHVSPATGTA